MRAFTDNPGERRAWDEWFRDYVTDGPARTVREILRDFENAAKDRAIRKAAKTHFFMTTG